MSGPTTPTATYSGILNSLTQNSQQGSQPAQQYTAQTSTAGQGNEKIGQNAADIAAGYGAKIASVGQQGANAQAGYETTGTTPVAVGNSGIIAQNIAAQQSALAQGESAALQGTGQQLTAQNQEANAENAAAGQANTSQGLVQSGLNQAGTLATPSNAYMQVPYSNQVVGANGQTTSGGTSGTLPQTAQDFVNSLAQQVKSGQMTRAAAESELTPYSQAGLQALNSALGGTNFNTNASNASAGTTATGQQIQTAADSTNRALDTLATSFSSLPGWQTGTIPAGNSIGQWIGSQFGDAALQTYKTNLADARSQLIGVLNSSGGTPTGNEATANQYLPDNMTPAMFQQNVGTAQNPGIVRQLMQQKVQSFTQSGQQNNTSNVAGGSTSGSIYSW